VGDYITRPEKAIVFIFGPVGLGLVFLFKFC